MRNFSRFDVYTAIDKERNHQIEKWGLERDLSILDYVRVLLLEVEEVLDGIEKDDQKPRSTALEELTQVAAVAIACLEHHGLKGNKSMIDKDNHEPLDTDYGC
jgi:NTP pyrophosphatase (non-canonical NTP hydrolase)